jgi:hypothetical protein
MASITVRNLTLRRLLRASSLSSSARSSLGVSVPSRLMSSSPRQHDPKFYEMGWLDDRGLTQFKTLHENQVRSCAIFSENPLYGIHNPETDNFEFKTYKEFGEQVNVARDVLKHLGEIDFR